MAKSVKVHEDTHRALKALKSKKRSRSIDAVIREMIRATAGVEVGTAGEPKVPEITSYVDG